MFKFSGRARLLSLGLASALAVTALLAGAFVVEAKVPAKKHISRFVAAQKRLIIRKLARPHQAFAAKPVAKPIVRKSVVAARPIAKPVLARPVVRPPTQQQILAARLKALPKTAFRAPVVRPAPPAKAPIRVALARPAPYRPAPGPAIAKPVSLAPAAIAPPPVVVRPGGPALLAQNGDWSVFRAISADNRTCFAATRPKDSSPRLADRKPVFLYLTTYAPGDVRNEVTFKLGMPLGADETVIAVIDGRNYRLGSSGDMAYPKDLGGQKAMLDGLRRGTSLTLRTAKADAPAGSPPTMTDAFSLLGLAAAVKASDEACINPTGRR